MKTNLKIIFCAIIFNACSSCSGNCIYDNASIDEAHINIDSLLDAAVSNYKVLIGNAEHAGLFPLSVKANGEIKLVNASHWTSGFFPGTLWYLYEYTNDNFFKEKAMAWTSKLEQEKNNGRTHDIGFMIYCSVGNGYRLTRNNEYLNIILDASKTLSGRFDPKIGCIRSWDWGKWKYPVIIDNMMNLEMLFFAAQKSNNPHYNEIAVSHAQKTLRNHFRKDYSCWHVVDYDPNNGKVLGKYTHQGYSDTSTWTRGVAWSIYGSVLCYRETGNTDFLRQADNIFDFIKNHPRMPQDHIPWWDMDCPGIPDTYRDVSSASIMAAALAELFNLTNNKRYLSYCEMLVRNMATKNYLLDSNEKFGFILDHSVGNIHKNWEVDEPLNYADYYFIEALLKLKKIYEDV